MSDVLLLVLRSASLALVVTGLGMFTYAATKYGLLKTKPYVMSLGVGVLALMFRIGIEISSFTFVPVRWFLIFAPIWFGLYGLTFIISTMWLKTAADDRERAFKEALRAELEQEFKQNK